MTAARGIKAGSAYVELLLADSKLVRGLSQAQTKLRNFGRSVSSLGQKMTGMGALAAAPIALATKIFADFSDQMLSVKGVTGATAGEFQLLYDEAKRLGRTTSFTAAQVAGAMAELGRGGFKPQAILNATEAVLNLSRATGTDLAESAGWAAAALKQFNLPADQATRVADTLSRTANGSAQTLTDLGEALKPVGPIAMEAGENLEDVSTSLGILANNAIRGSLAGNSLARAYKNVATPAVQKTLRENGVEALTATGDLRKMHEILADLGAQTKHFTSAKKLALFETLFGRGQAAALKLAGPIADFKSLNDVIKKTGPTAKQTAEEMDSGLGGSLRRLMSAVEGIAIAVGEQLAPLFETWSEALQTAAAWVTKVAQKNQGLLQGLVIGIAVVTALGAGLVVLGVIAGSISAIFGLFAGILTAAGTAVGVVGSVIAALLSPIGLVAAAVVGLGGYFLFASEAGSQALDWLSGVMGTFKDEALAVFGAVRDALASGDFELAAKVMWAGLKLAWVQGTSFLKQVWAEFKTEFMKIATEAWFGAAISLNNAWSGLEKAWANTTAFFSKIWKGFVGFVLTSWNSISGAIRKAWAKVKATVKGTSAEAEVKRIDEETKRKENEILNRTAQEIKDRETERQRELAQIAQTQQGANTELVSEADRINAGRRAESDKAIAAAAAEVEQARADLKASLAEVHAKPGETGPEKPKGPGEFDPQKFAEQFQGGIKTALRTESKANTGAVLGTDEGTKALFSAFRFAGGDPADQTAKNTKAMADEMKRMKQEQKKTNEQLKNAPVAKLEKV